MSAKELHDALSATPMKWADIAAFVTANMPTILRAHADALEENARLRAEANDDDALRERMADILTRTAAALKGEPEPLTLHDWSGLPEIAERAVSELAKLRQKLMRYEHAEAADTLHPPQDEQARADFPEEK